MRFVAPLLAVLDAQAVAYAHVAPGELAAPSRCAGWSVGDVMQHSLGVTTKLSAFAVGRTDRPRTPVADLLGHDHADSFRHVASAAARAWTEVDPHRTCRLGFGAFPAGLTAGINLFDALAHTWDVASALDHRLDIPTGLWEAATDAAVAVIGPDPDPAHYGPARPCDPAAPADVRFLRLLGRDVPPEVEPAPVRSAGNPPSRR